MNNSVLNYYGKVKVKLKIKDKVVEIEDHNNGLPALFKNLSKFLTTNLSNYQDIVNATPQYLDLQHYENNDWVSFLVKRTSLSAKSFVNEGSEGTPIWKALFTGVIAYKDLRETITDTMQGAFRITLVSGALENLATLSISAADLARITPGTQSIIEWSMYVINNE